MMMMTRNYNNMVIMTRNYNNMVIMTRNNQQQGDDSDILSTWR